MAEGWRKQLPKLLFCQHVNWRNLCAHQSWFVACTVDCAIAQPLSSLSAIAYKLSLDGRPLLGKPSLSWRLCWMYLYFAHRVLQPVPVSPHGALHCPGAQPLRCNLHLSGWAPRKLFPMFPGASQIDNRIDSRFPEIWDTTSQNFAEILDSKLKNI